MKVAEKAGVSIATVSKIINNKAHASEKTIQRVKSAMQELSYVPRPPSLRPGRHMGTSARHPSQISVIFTEMLDSQFRNSVFGDLLLGIQQGLQKRNLTMTFCVLPPGGRLPKSFSTQSFQGSIIVGPSRPLLDGGTEVDHHPMVHAMGQPTDWADCVLPDNVEAGRLAAHHLIEAGAGPFAVFRELDHAVSELRADSFCQAMAERGSRVQEYGAPSLHLVDHEHHIGSRKLLGDLLTAMLAANPRPIGLFLPDDLVAAAIYPLLQERGIQPQKDIRIVSCNNQQAILGALSPRPVEINLHADVVGQLAVEHLLWRIENPKKPRIRTYVSPSLVHGG